MERSQKIKESMDLLVHTDDNKIIIKLMKRWGIARRTAREYLDVMLDNDN